MSWKVMSTCVGTVSRVRVATVIRPTAIVAAARYAPRYAQSSMVDYNTSPLSPIIDNVDPEKVLDVVQSAGEAIGALSSGLMYTSPMMYASGKVAAIGATIGSGAGAGVSAATPAVIQALGFGAAGIAKGSIVAGIHSTIGNVAAGSVFASLQSAGAAGAISWATVGGITAVGTVAGVVVVPAAAACYWWLQ